ncbi:hypothetical protein H0Z60_02555 [Ectothiorhodospiraceae bacterium WFHF3C12]|nr:hypothetical protein [Ectothiorhodospiraceae bacterium WFHF3C12]
MSALADSGYYALLSSLPALPALDRAEQPPISQLRLRARLSDLDETDRDDLATVEGLLHWERMALSAPDAPLIESARTAMPRLARRRLDDLVRERLELRTAMAALRRRAQGRPAPGRHEPWGFGRYTDLIRRHWDRPALGLEHVMPAVTQFQRLLAGGDSSALEQALLRHVWGRLSRAGEGHYFDFRAVVIYVLRWNILDRWVSYDAAAASERFTLLCDDATADIRLPWETSA